MLTELPAYLGAAQSIARTMPGSWSRSFCCQECPFVFTSSAFPGCCFKYSRNLSDATEDRREHITCVQEQQLPFRTPISAFSTSVAKWQCSRQDKSPTQGRLQPYVGIMIEKVSSQSAESITPNRFVFFLLQEGTNHIIFFWKSLACCSREH